MRVSDTMSRDVQVARPEDTIARAAEIMVTHDAGVLPVGDGERLVGMITDRDIAVRAVAAGKGPETPVREVMSRDVKYCFEDQELEVVARNMGEVQLEAPAGGRSRQAAGGHCLHRGRRRRLSGQDGRPRADGRDPPRRPSQPDALRRWRPRCWCSATPSASRGRERKLQAFARRLAPRPCALHLGCRRRPRGIRARARGGGCAAGRARAARFRRGGSRSTRRRTARTGCPACSLPELLRETRA